MNLAFWRRGRRAAEPAGDTPPTAGANAADRQRRWRERQTDETLRTIRKAGGEAALFPSAMADLTDGEQHPVMNRPPQEPDFTFALARKP